MKNTRSNARVEIIESRIVSKKKKKFLCFEWFEKVSADSFKNDLVIYVSETGIRDIYVNGKKIEYK